MARRPRKDAAAVAPPVSNVERELGRLSANVEALTDGQVTLVEKIEAIERQLHTARGGWRMLLVLLSAASIIGGIVVKLLGMVPVR